jgi:hypothetical protein
MDLFLNGRDSNPNPYGPICNSNGSFLNPNGFCCDPSGSFFNRQVWVSDPYESICDPNESKFDPYVAKAQNGAAGMRATWTVKPARRQVSLLEKVNQWLLEIENRHPLRLSAPTRADKIRDMDTPSQPSPTEPSSPPPADPQRHGCLTAWLVLMIIANAATVFMTPLSIPSMRQAGLDPSPIGIGVIVLCGIANIIFAIALFRWMKWGFYGFVATSAVALVTNLMMGLSIAASLFGLVGIALLYWVLNMGGENKAWPRLR